MMTVLPFTSKEIEVFSSLSLQYTPGVVTCTDVSFPETAGAGEEA